MLCTQCTYTKGRVFGRQVTLALVVLALIASLASSPVSADAAVSPTGTVTSSAVRVKPDSAALGSSASASALSEMPDPVDHEWWVEVQEFIERDLYSVWPAQEQAGTAFRATNVRSRVEVTFPTRGGFLVNPASDPSAGAMSGAQLSVQTTEAAETWSWGLRPHALGVGMRMIALGSPYAGEARQDTLTNLYDIPWLLAGRQPAGLVEWFHNDRAGLRQNFTIAARPPGSRSDSLTLQLAQEGDLQADLLAGGHGLRLYDAEGAAVLSYDRLYVFDADGRSLDAWFELGHGLAIVVDDAEARYPITIDPVTTAAAGPAIVAGEATGSSFGAVVASAGDVNGDGFDDLAVGAPGFNGSTGKVYVFHGSASGVTSTAANPSFSVTGEAAANYFGETVEGAGDVNGDGYDDLAVGTSREQLWRQGLCVPRQCHRSQRHGGQPRIQRLTPCSGGGECRRRQW